jgi:hypothetical protein
MPVDVASGAADADDPAACAAPQLGQKPALSAMFAPHLVQCGMKGLLVGPGLLPEAKPSKPTGGRQADLNFAAGGDR